MVANILHLGTGFISPQYHCVFDNLFETVFGNQKLPGAVYDALCNLLWENSRDLYAEEEFDDDGMLVYEPPPLDTVWLDEPARRERKVKLRQQRDRTQQRELDKQIQLQPDKPPPPPYFIRLKSLVSNHSLRVNIKP